MQIRHFQETNLSVFLRVSEENPLHTRLPVYCATEIQIARHDYNGRK